MLTVVLVILLAMVIIPFILSDFDGDVLGALMLILIIPIACVSIFLFDNVNKILDGKIINDKIKMYNEENIKIENQIDTLVKEYMQFENETLGNFKSESSMTLVQLYPDLKSNELVIKQINTYTENNNKIKELKEQKLNVSKAKWWVYFGK